MSLKLNSTGGGSVTLDSGSTPNNVTITLPGVNGTMATLGSVTNNGVVYVNSSGQPTSGSALVYTATGLGIGTSSPGAKLEVANGNMLLSNNYSLSSRNAANTTTISLISRNTSDQVVIDPDGYGLKMGFGGPLFLNGSGNLGLGVTPSAWASGYKVFDIGNAAVHYPNSASQIGVSANAYFNGTSWLYKASSFATLALQNSGQHIWYNAPSGTAGNAISFTQAMTLDASGNLIIGDTSGSSGINLVRSGIDTAELKLKQTGTGGRDYRIGSTGTGYGSAGNFIIYDATANAERMRITSGGEVYIAGTTDQGAYNLQCNGTGVWGAGAYVNGSDARLKEEVADIESGLDVVTAMRPVTFRYKEDYSKDQSTQPGFIAQELQAAMQGKNYLDGVVQSGPEYLNVAYQNLIPILTKAIQELKAELDELKAKVQA